MCLTEITKTKNFPESMIGYKTVIIRYGKIFTADKDFCIGELGDKITNDIHKNIHITPTRKYKSGFHFWTNKKSARQWRDYDEKIIKIRATNITTKGKQIIHFNDHNHICGNVGVAQTIELLEVVE